MSSRPIDLSSSTADSGQPGAPPNWSGTLPSEPDYGEILSMLPLVILRLVDGAIVEVNRPDAPFFTRVAAPGDALADLFDDHQHRLVQSLVDTARNSETAEGALESPTARLRVVARRLKSTPGVMVFFQDVSAQRSAEHTLMELLRDKSSFLATVGHQLRTPLTAVIGYADMLSQSDSDLDDHDRSDMVRDMTDQAWDLAGIIEDLLTVARAEIGDLAVVSHPVNLTANASQVIESIGDRGRRILITGDRSVTGVGDPGKFRQIVRNLLSNALTHGAEPITVHVTSTETRAILSIRDRGPGVPEEIQDAMFARFVATSDHSNPGRVGIGLWIARELASLMGGQVEYGRDHGMTTFRVSIPLKPPTD